MYQVDTNTYPAGPGTPPRSPPPDPQRPPSGLPPRSWDTCPSAWTARWTGDARDAPAQRDAPRRAPEVTREWPAEPRRHAIEPLDMPLLVMAAASLAATLALLVPRADGGILLAALLLYLCAAGILLVASTAPLPPPPIRLWRLWPYLAAADGWHVLANCEGRPRKRCRNVDMYINRPALICDHGCGRKAGHPRCPPTFDAHCRESERRLSKRLIKVPDTEPQRDWMSSLKMIEKTLKRNKPMLMERFKVKSIGVFGSYARAEEDADSDVDLLVELEEPIGWEIVDLKEFLEGILGLEVDIVTTKALRRELSDTIMREVVFA